MYMKNERMNTVRKIRILYIVDMMGMEQTYTQFLLPVESIRIRNE